MKKKLNEAEVMQHSMKLRQMGGDVTVINSKMCYVKFDVSGFRVEYAYNVNKHQSYFLERVSPYPLPFREFESEEDVIDLIAIDLEQFESAIKSHNINCFVEINRKLHNSILRFEDLFLYYNVPKDDLQSILDKVNEIEAKIVETKEKSERLYFKKDPDSLK